MDKNKQAKIKKLIDQKRKELGLDKLIKAGKLTKNESTLYQRSKGSA